MSSELILKQLLMNKLYIPRELIYLTKCYVFVDIKVKAKVIKDKIMLEIEWAIRGDYKDGCLMFLVDDAEGLNRQFETYFCLRCGNYIDEFSNTVCFGLCERIDNIMCKCEM